MVVNTGGIAGLLNVIRCTEEFPYTPAVLALGFIAALSPELALAIIQSKVFYTFLFRYVKQIYDIIKYPC